MKLNTTYDPFGMWAAGPWMLVDLSLQFARSWQEAWLSRMQLGAPAPARSPLSLLRVERGLSAPAQGAKEAVRLPKMGCLDGVEVVGGPSPQPSLPVAEKARVVARQAIIEPPRPSVEDDPAPASSSVTSMLALQARSLSKAVSRAPKVAESVVAKAASGARKPVSPAARTAAKSAAKPASKLAVKPAAPAADGAAKVPAKRSGSKKA